MVNRKIIAFCGKAGAGKDFSCSRLMMTKGYKKLAFADALRYISFKTLGIPYDKGMANYDRLKSIKVVNDLTFRNIMENLGEGVRRYDPDFWARTVLTIISECHNNICISDLRYTNEYFILRDYCKDNNINFKLVFCDYHSDRYEEENLHVSAALANYLKSIGYKDQDYVEDVDVVEFSLMKSNTP